MSNSSAPAVMKSHAPLRFWQQLRWNLGVYFLVLAILPVVVAQAITLSLTAQDGQSGVINQLQSVATLKSNQLQRWIQETQTTMDLILADPSHYTDIVNYVSSPDNTSTQQAINALLQNVVTGKI